MDGAIRAHSWSENLRTVELDGKPWFHAGDACRIIGLNIKKGTAQALRHIDREDRRLIKRSSPEGVRVAWGDYEPSATFITKGGLYVLIMRAQTKRPEVAEFQRWVTHEVLPAIEETGGYLLNETARETAHADSRRGVAGTVQLTLTLGERTSAPSSSMRTHGQGN